MGLGGWEIIGMVPRGVQGRPGIISPPAVAAGLSLAKNFGKFLLK
jgi:hypothetical protein